MPADDFKQPNGALNPNWIPDWTVPNGQTPPVIVSYEMSGKAPNLSYSSALFAPFSFTDAQDTIMTVQLGPSSNIAETYLEFVKLGTEADPTTYFALVIAGSNTQRIYKFKRSDAGGLVVQVGPSGNLVLAPNQIVTFRKTGPYHEIRVDGVFATAGIDSQYTGPWRGGVELYYNIVPDTLSYLRSTTSTQRGRSMARLR